ncbi:MAG: S46 family peptidase, partial [Flavobacteriales bacterium]|nr:S46 family peptidase [Flavobacteriales bacterium]
MTKKLLSIIFLSVLTFSLVKADEGMWLPQLLQSMNESDMKDCGLQLTAQDLYDVNNSSLKDAIVALNGGMCTGEMISSQGLMLTNHHCAFDVIQTHSTVDNDYLTDGFWAMTRDAELPNEGFSVSFLVSIESVTDRVLEDLGEVTESERKTKLREIFNEISSEKIDGTDYNARVKSFFGGNEFYLMTYITYNDVRLVGAPPSSIGKFGGDTDNWMWPRHTGDFSLLRVYCAPDGSPSEYSEENIPYTPKHHLPIQLDGVDNGDYTMIFGFPGSTDRFLTSFGIQEALEQTNPTIVQIRSEKLAIMKSGMDANKKTKIQYASKYAGTSNYWKYYIGQSRGLKRMKVYDKKVEIENKFTDWVNSGGEQRYEKFGNTLNLIKEAYDDNRELNISRTYLNEAIFQGAEIMYFSFIMNRKLANIPSDKEEKIIFMNEIREEAQEFYKNYNSTIDEELFSAMLEMYYYNVPQNQHPSVFKKIENQLLGFKAFDFDYYAKDVFRKSIFSSEDKFLAFLENPYNMKLEKDPAYTTMMSIYDYYIEHHYAQRKSVRAKLDEGNRLFIAGLREMNPEENYYPNANSTMRVTYGNVGDYNPGDAMHYDFYTTIDGIIEKEDPTNDEFIVPEKLKELYEIGDYGQYADENGNLRINFISNNDITGGNSGSPVINAWGEIVGTAFDGNWEAMSGDIAFENEIQRTISVDIRYTMFIIDKFAGATHLIDEMTIAPTHLEKT